MLGAGPGPFLSARGGTRSSERTGDHDNEAQNDQGRDDREWRTDPEAQYGTPGRAQDHGEW